MRLDLRDLCPRRLKHIDDMDRFAQLATVCRHKSLVEYFRTGVSGASGRGPGCPRGARVRGV